MSLGETRHQLRLALARHVIGQHYLVDLDSIVDELLNQGVDRPVLIDLAVSSPDLPRSHCEIIRRLIQELAIQPENLTDQAVAAQVLDADYAQRILDSPGPRDTQAGVASWMRHICDRNQSELAFYTDSPYSWLSDISDRFDAATWESKRSRFALRKLELAADVARDAKVSASDFLQETPDVITDPA